MQITKTVQLVADTVPEQMLLAQIRIAINGGLATEQVGKIDLLRIRESEYHAYAMPMIQQFRNSAIPGATSPKTAESDSKGKTTKP